MADMDRYMGINYQDRMELIEVLWDNKFAIMDIEYIQCTKEHKCIRSFYILCDNKVDCFQEFRPCKNLLNLEGKYFNAFMYNKKNIHRLPYYPKNGYRCSYFLTFLCNFIMKNEVKMILYKGGTVESSMCEKISQPCMNIELLGCPKIKSHNPEEEVQSHFEFIKSLL